VKLFRVGAYIQVEAESEDEAVERAFQIPIEKWEFDEVIDYEAEGLGQVAKTTGGA